ncbi:FkbM family methyltransferase [Tropicimonas sp. IMCC34011]|uniref:FkbM family methyltransferase n=1 Tax=Tropicimonas sp. IMCC34011 TaxID=2248759 RepID=UPI000E243E5D|nr:FkbM family methyltransferase [Tropicimonas sp. IMCC34011]
MDTWDLDGIRVEDPHGAFSPALRRAMGRGRYERPERQAVADLVRAGDRILELGAGCGVIGVAAARITGPDRVTSIEANPSMESTIRHTHRINDCPGIDLRIGAVAAEGGGTAPFHLSRDFWASSFDPETPNLTETVSIPLIGIDELVRESAANVLLCDIEGAEHAIIPAMNLAPLDLVIMELHPTPGGLARMGALFAALIGAGLHPDIEAGRTPRVAIFRRPSRD